MKETGGELEVQLEEVNLNEDYLLIYPVLKPLVCLRIQKSPTRHPHSTLY